MSEDLHRTISITSGKGGVGKSCIAYNLAVSISRQGFKTLLVDTDFGKFSDLSSPKLTPPPKIGRRPNWMFRPNRIAFSGSWAS